MPTTRAQYRDQLQIDENDLDRCMIEHAELFDHVAEALVEAEARRDTLKLQLEEATAELAQGIRTRAARNEEKLTEGSLKEQLQILPRIKELNQDLLAASTEADRWAVTKDSYKARASMLKEINASQIARMYNLSLERGGTGARHRIGEQARAVAEEQRASARRGANERYRGSSDR